MTSAGTSRNSRGRRRTPSRSAVDPFAASGHDHRKCIDDALDAASILCQERGVRLTDLRRQVLELVWQGHQPVGAYELLERLRGPRGTAAPPTVYRALNFLCDQGLVHRIDSLNAYVGCAVPESTHRAYFLLCDDCGQVGELVDHNLGNAITRSAQRVGFTTENETIELRGRCADCSRTARRGSGTDKRRREAGAR